MCENKFMPTKEKRVVKGYKIKESVYVKAKKRADKKKEHLATLIEEWVSAYAAGSGMLMYASSHKKDGSRIDVAYPDMPPIKIKKIPTQ